MEASKKTTDQRERQLAYWRDYNEQHREERRTYLKQWYQDNKEIVKEKQRLYRIEKAEKVREGAAHRYETNKDHWQKVRKAYYTRNRKKILKEHKDRRADYFSKDPKEAWLHYTHLGACHRARKKGLPYDKDLSGLHLPDVCPVLGIPLKYAGGRGSATYDSSSLDRIIPELGYVRSNLRVISYRANLLKSNASLDELKCVVSYIEECQKLKA